MALKELNATQKKACLMAIYAFYDEFIRGLPISCAPGCSVCCTNNVAATTIEIECLLDSIPLGVRKTVGESLHEALAEPRFIPRYTTNQIASACLKQKQVPEEDGRHGKGRCPLLSEDLCMAYEYRPFACRAMLSRTQCAPDSPAYMGGFVVTINLAIYQIIEHLDRGNPYGNMIDLLAWRLGVQNLAETVPASEPLPGFVLLPDEKGRFNSFIKRLSKKIVKEMDATLGDILGCL